MCVLYDSRYLLSWSRAGRRADGAQVAMAMQLRGFHVRALPTLALHLSAAELGAMLEELQVATAAQLRDAEGELRFWLKELDPDADKRITEREFETALSRYAVWCGVAKAPDMWALLCCCMTCQYIAGWRQQVCHQRSVCST